MRTPRHSTKFKKDLVLAEKRHKDIPKLKQAMELLAGDVALAEKYKDHPLKGEFRGCRECHLEPDWLLVYLLSPGEIHFLRTGTHSDIFK